MYPTTILELLRTGADYLKSHGVDDSRAEADIILAYILHTTRDKLYLNINDTVPNHENSRYVEWYGGYRQV